MDSNSEASDKPSISFMRIADLADGRPEGPLLIYLQKEDGKFALGGRMDAYGPADLQLSDIDLDGHLDLVSAGRIVQIVHGPLLAPGTRTCEQLAWPTVPGEDPKDLFALGLDVTHVMGSGAPGEVLVAASKACFSIGSCERVKTPGVATWRRKLEGDGSWRTHLLTTEGFAAAVRFTELEPNGPLDLLVGLMTPPICQCSHPSKIRGVCIGAPLLVFRGAEGRPERIDLLAQDDRPLLPMGFRLLPHVDCLGEGKLEDKSQRHQLTRGNVVTYLGKGWIDSVKSVTHNGRSVGFHHVYGDHYVSLTERLEGAVEVHWRVAQQTNYLYTSMSPIGASLYIYAPTRRQGL